MIRFFSLAVVICNSFIRSYRIIDNFFLSARYVENRGRVMARGRASGRRRLMEELKEKGKDENWGG